MRASLRHAVVLAAALAVLVLVAAACGSSGSSASGSPTTSAPAATATSSPGGGSTSGLVVPSGSSATVKVANLPGFGPVLVSSTGRTLYLYTPDKGSHSACSGGCLQAWPPISAANPTAGKGVKQNLLTAVNAAAKNQLMYNGHLLYYYVADTKPGQVTGASIPEWYPVSPSGQLVKKH